MNFHKDELFHYISCPIDHWGGYIWLPDLRKELEKRYAALDCQTLGIRHWLDESMMILKRIMLDTKLKDIQWRDNDIWCDIIKRHDHAGISYRIESIHILIKEDNNGTVHLFTFHELSDRINFLGLQCYNAKHEFGGDWELYNEVYK